jgi:uncharacterized protein (DUF2147 family)
MRPLELAILSLLAGWSCRSPAATTSIEGIWINPRGTVAVRTAQCGARLCGHIVWASPEAAADARDGGVQRLVGTELLQDYRAIGPGRWSGRVFVPDMGRSFSSTLQQLGPDSLKIQGCVIGGLLCKSQTWHRR